MKNNKLFRMAVPLFVALIFLALVVPALAAEQMALKGKFRGVGNDFSGVAMQLGRFDGLLDPITATAVWTFANGDTLTNQTTSFELVEEIKPGVYTYVQIIEITGGSGRFEDATGSATVTGLYNLVTGKYHGLINGSLSIPNDS